MASETRLCTPEEIQDIKARFPMAKERKTPPYAYWQIALQDCIITAYESGKVLFQGESATLYANGFGHAVVKKLKVTKQEQEQKNIFPQAGSDEVGTGDYFGPITVCAVYVSQEVKNWLQTLQIQDSKMMTDEKIREIAPVLMQKLPHSLLILDNETYNRVHSHSNMVEIKCKLHNQAMVHLQKKISQWPNLVVIDQFVSSTSYYRYLQKEKEVVRQLHFETKAENKYLAVACGSIIARYAFLKAMDHMNVQYQFTFLKGASSKVDENIRQFVQLHGKTALRKVAKLHFANTKKAGIESLS